MIFHSYVSLPEGKYYFGLKMQGRTLVSMIFHGNPSPPPGRPGAPCGTLGHPAACTRDKKLLALERQTQNLQALEVFESPAWGFMKFTTQRNSEGIFLRSYFSTRSGRKNTGNSQGFVTDPEVFTDFWWKVNLPKALDRRMAGYGRVYVGRVQL